MVHKMSIAIKIIAIGMCVCVLCACAGALVRPLPSIRPKLSIGRAVWHVLPRGLHKQDGGHNPNAWLAKLPVLLSLSAYSGCAQIRDFLIRDYPLGASNAMKSY